VSGEDGHRIDGQLHVPLIDADGRVRDAMVSKSLEPSLDDNAVLAISKWIFKPGRLNDVPVPVRITIGMQFRLH